MENNSKILIFNFQLKKVYINFNYKFNWLLNADGIGLGELIEKQSYIEKNHSLALAEVFNLVNEKCKREEKGNKPHNHVDMFHIFNKIFNKLMLCLVKIKNFDFSINKFDIYYLLYKFKRSIKK